MPRRAAVHLNLVASAPGLAGIFEVPLTTRGSFAEFLEQLLESGDVPVDKAQDSPGGLVLLIFTAADLRLPLLRRWRHRDRFCGPAPLLSWRLAAHHLLSRLPTETTSPPAPTTPGSAVLAIAPDRALRGPLRISPAVLGPLRAVAHRAQLLPLLRALRAGHPTADDLVHMSTLPNAFLRRYLSALRLSGLITAAPSGTDNASHPFDLLGLHWSAYDAEIRRAYFDHPSDRRTRPLEAAFHSLLHRPLRSDLRARLLQPPALGEALRHFRTDLQRLLPLQDGPRIIDRCRRILEITPDDRDVRRLLTRQLLDLHYTPQPFTAPAVNPPTRYV